MVSAGEVFVLLGTAMALLAALTRFMAVRRVDKKMANISAVLSLMTFAAITAALVYLIYLFMTSDMGYYYVWSYSTTDLDGAYKFSAVWAGAEGSFLVWIWFMALVLAVEVMLEPRRGYLKSRFHGVFQVCLSLILFIFLVILVNMDLFVGTRDGLLKTYSSSFVDSYLAAYPNGYGMNLLLQTPEMVIHPPVVFAGYAFCAASFSAAAAYFITGDRNWFKVSLPWTRLAWIFLTLGIGIGAIWAYYVLGWGGYWGWDPVETSSLLPWLVATAFLHTQVRHARKGEYGIVSPSLGMVSLVAVIFATFVTRAGSIWASSVHAFGGAAGETAADRLIFLLENNSTVLSIFTLMVMMFAVTVYLAIDKYRSEPRAEQPAEPERLSEYVSDKNNMLFTVFLLVITSVVMLLMLFKNVEVQMDANYAEFNQKMSLFFVALMATMSVCLVWRFLGKEIAFWLGLGIVVISAVLVALAAASGAFDALVGFSLPSYAVAVGASAFKLAKSGVKGSVRKTLQRASPHVIHLGVALMLLGYVVSSNMQVFPEDTADIEGLEAVELDIGEQLVVGDYTVELVSLSVRSEYFVTGGSTVLEAHDATIDIARSGKTVQSGTVLTDLYGLGPDGRFQALEVEVHVHKTAFTDLYVNFQTIDNNTAILEAKIVPFMNPLWGGFGLIVVGLAIRTVAWQQEPKEESEPGKRAAPATAKKPAESPAREKDYEALVEEELRKYKERKKSG